MSHRYGKIWLILVNSEANNIFKLNFLNSWISNTYFYDMNQSIPKSEIERSKNEIKYYQWVSFVLLVQALFFYFPRILWRTLSIKAGLNIADLV